MFHYSFIEFSVVNTGDGTHLYFFDLFIAEISNAELVLGLGQVDYFFMRPKSILSTFGQSESFFKFLCPCSVVLGLCVVLVAIRIAMGVGF